jgi:cyclohexa-1,5-dienecarbonyl-CoA hydratase
LRKGMNASLAEPEPGVFRITIERPPLNILDIPAICELSAQVEAASNVQDGGAPRLLEIRGAGGAAFSAGIEIRDHFPERAREMLRAFHGLIRAILAAPCPVAAVVEGHCLGGGMELALACDFILASDDATFGQPEIRVGAFPPVASILLPRLIPEKKAAEMILTGCTITAVQAAQMGLVNRLGGAGTLEGKLSEFERELLTASPRITSLALRAIRARRLDGFEAALRESERLYLDELLQQKDATEGLKAFLEKRPPRWES